MKKYLLLIMVLAGTSLLTSCGQSAKKEETSSEVDKMLEQMESSSLVEPLATAGSMAQPTASASGMPGSTNLPSQMAASPEISVLPGAFEKPAVQTIQQALQNAGLYQGKIDGDLGPKTKKAIKDFQAQNGLTADGKVGPRTWQKLAPYSGQGSTAADPSAVSNDISN